MDLTFFSDVKLACDFTVKLPFTDMMHCRKIQFVNGLTHVNNYSMIQFLSYATENK